MYIRWIVRGHKSEEADVTFHDAYLVESYRDEQGSPRQNTIAYLGNIRQIGDAFPAIERELFLLRAELIVDDIASLSKADRDDILAKLQEKVPPLNADEVMAGFLNTLRWYFHTRQAEDNQHIEADLLRLIQKAKEMT